MIGGLAMTRFAGAAITWRRAVAVHNTRHSLGALPSTDLNEGHNEAGSSP
jgi:hypothetical protein